MSEQEAGLTLSVTATQDAVTVPQLCAMVETMEDYWKRGYRNLRHGDCVGGDAVFHCIGRALGFHIIVHPPENASKRAFMRGDFSHHPMPYLIRNDVIARKADDVLAAPKTMDEEQRSGTWATIRYAWHHGKAVQVCYPDGYYAYRHRMHARGQR